jgi:hypothetical protein
MGKALGAVGCLLALGAAAPGARASDLEDFGFGIRFTSALHRFSRYPDLAGIGGAGGGSPWSSSPNPAATGLNPSTGARGFGVSAQYGQVVFDEGTNVYLGSTTGSIDGRATGEWQVSVLGARTNRAETSDGLTFEWEALGADVLWARKVSPCTAVGASFGIVDSTTRFDVGPLDFVDGETTTYTVRAGVTHQFSKTFVAGVSFEHAWAPDDTLTRDVFGLGVGDVTTSDVTRTFAVRTGIYTFLTKDLTLYADHTFARFSNDAEVLPVHRFAAGLDLTVREGVYARAGAVMDRWGNASLTAGIGIAPSKSLLFDVSYQYEMFPELEPEFGRAHVFGVGLTVLF